ncbi:MAG: oligosaccharide flippase family protein [Candidatus Micrarchaeia archaeon]
MSRILKDSIIYSATNLFAYVASIVRGIVVARLLGPATYGLSNIISMVADYGGFAQLGSHSAFFFKKTRLDARSEFKESEELQAITFSWTILVCCVFALVLILLSFLLSLGSVERWLLRIVGFYVLFQQCINLVVTVLQAERKLVEVGKIQALLGLFSAAAAIIATFYFGLVGLWGALLASSAIVLFFVLMGGRVKLHWAWNRRKIAVLLVYGLPIMIYGLLFYALLGVDRILVVVLLGQTNLGYYAIAVFFASFVIVLAQYFSNALLPRIMPMIEKSDEKGIKKYYSLYLYSASVFSALLVGLLYSFSFVILKLFFSCLFIFPR